MGMRLTVTLDNFVITPPPPPTLVTPTYIPSFAGESRLTTGAPND